MSAWHGPAPEVIAPPVYGLHTAPLMPQTAAIPHAPPAPVALWLHAALGAHHDAPAAGVSERDGRQADSGACLTVIALMVFSICSQSSCTFSGGWCGAEVLFSCAARCHACYTVFVTGKHVQAAAAGFERHTEAGARVGGRQARLQRGVRTTTERLCTLLR